MSVNTNNYDKGLKMRRYLFIALTLLHLVSSPVFGASRGDVNIIEATESIRYLSQKMAKEYLYLYKYPDNHSVKSQLYATLKKLEENLRIISAATKDTDTNDILDFLAYSKEHIYEIIKKEPTKDRIALMMDYSETLLEGADSIALNHAYAFSDEEKMLVVSKNISYLLERAFKYYLARYIGLDTQINRQQLSRSMEELQMQLEKVNTYAQYPERMIEVKRSINEVWKHSAPYIEDDKSYFIPSLLFDNITFLEKNLDELVLYHGKNL